MKIYPIKTGEVWIKTAQRKGKGRGLARRVNMFLDREWTEPLPILAWLIDHPEGPIVVDTGETSRTAEPAYFPRWHPFYRYGVREEVTADQEIGPQLARLGIDPIEVAIVVLTHFHTDHAGGIYHFPKSQWVVNSIDLNRARGLPGKLRGFLPQHWPHWFSPDILVSAENAPDGPWEGFPYSFPITKDGRVRVVPTPGHTPGHQSVVVDDGAIVYFLAGDTSYDQDLLIAQSLDGVTSDESAGLATMRRILDLAERRPTIYLPSHDFNSIQRLNKREALRGVVHDFV